MTFRPNYPREKLAVFMLIVFAAFICGVLFGCNKEQAPEPAKPIIEVEQDQSLFGGWSQDSSKMDGSVTAYATDPDSVYITPQWFKKVSYWDYGTSYQSKLTSQDSWVTSGDSLFLNTNGVEGNHYQYTVDGNTLTLYLNSHHSNDVKYFYHK